MPDRATKKLHSLGGALLEPTITTKTEYEKTAHKNRIEHNLIFCSVCARFNSQCILITLFTKDRPRQAAAVLLKIQNKKQEKVKANTQSNTYTYTFLVGLINNNNNDIATTTAIIITETMKIIIKINIHKNKKCVWSEVK